MNLWIRSQDKFKIVKVENFQVNFERIICLDKVEGIITLGEYKTKERALEVLDEIQNKLLNSRYVDIKNGANDYINGYANNLIVYEMPKE